MKPIQLTNVLTLAGFMLLCACQRPKGENSTEQESATIAKEANDSIFTDRKEEKDADFVVNVVAASYGEIKMAQLAHNKSVDDQLKEMAATLEQDHTKALNGLKGFADLKGIAIPLEETEADSKQLSELDKQSVDKFDKEWTKAMESRHKKSIDAFEKRMERTEDPDLKAWISSTLPALRSHLAMLEQHTAK